MPDRMPSPSAPQDQSPQGSPQDTKRDPEGSDNPFAPPPEGAPEQPWRPRHPQNDGEGGDGSAGPGWSAQQPGRSSGGFGQRPGGPENGGGPGGSGGSGGPMGSMRWDPTDPAQRRARYALLGGMWAFFFALFSWTSLALLLGALAVYWGVSALRAEPRTPDPSAPAPAVSAGKPQRTAAISGLVAAGLALSVVAATFTVQMVYSDYRTCVSDALTDSAQHACEDKHPVPSVFIPLLGGPK